MTIPLGIVASATSQNPAVALLQSLTAYWDVSDYSGSGNIPNKGTVGSALDFVPGTTTAAPRWLPWVATNYLYLPLDDPTNNQVTVPDIVQYKPDTSLDLRAAINLDDWTPASGGHIVSQFSSGNRSWAFRVAPSSGVLEMELSTNGSASTAFVSTVATGFTDGTLHCVRAVWAVAGTINFYTKNTTEANAKADCQSNTGWTQLGTQVTASVPTTALFDGGNPIRWGGSPFYNGLGGLMYYSQVEVDGVVEASVDPSLGNGSSASWTNAQSRTVTITRSTSSARISLVSRPIFNFDGTTDWMSIADNANLDFGTADSFSIGLALRLWTPNADGRYITKDPTGASVGWLVYAPGSTAQQLQIGLKDGTNFTLSTGVAGTLGALRTVTAIRSVASDNVTVYNNTTANTPVTDASTATLANSNLVRLGASAAVTPGNFAAFEWIGGYVARRVLTAPEITLINTYFTSIT